MSGHIRPLFLCFGTLASALPASAAEPVWQDEWPRFQPEEYAITGGLMGFTGLYSAFAPDPKARWAGGVLLDKPVRNLLVARTPKARNTAARTSDVLLYSMALWPLTDSLVATARGGGDAGGQMALISLQSLSISAFGKQTVADLSGRERPYGPSCKDNADYMHGCGTPDTHRSFYSGHTAIAVTGAALVCTQHLNIDVYGGPGDTAACATAIVAASTVGTLRIVADKHYFSDVLVGATLGLGSGFLLPRLTHYRPSSRSPTTSSNPTQTTRTVTFRVAL